MAVLAMRARRSCLNDLPAAVLKICHVQRHMFCTYKVQYTVTCSGHLSAANCAMGVSCGLTVPFLDRGFARDGKTCKSTVQRTLIVPCSTPF